MTKDKNLGADAQTETTILEPMSKEDHLGADV